MKENLETNKKYEVKNASFYTDSNKLALNIMLAKSICLEKVSYWIDEKGILYIKGDKINYVYVSNYSYQKERLEPNEIELFPKEYIYYKYLNIWHKLFKKPKTAFLKSGYIPYIKTEQFFYKTNHWSIIN